MKREDKIKVIAKSLNKRTFGLSLLKEENLWLATVILDDLEAASKKRREAKKADKASSAKSDKKSAKKSKKK